MMYIDKTRGSCNSNSVGAVAFAWLIIGFNYYIFVFLVLKRLLEISSIFAVIIFIEFHIFTVLLIWSYLKTIFTGPGYISRNINEHFSNAESLKERQKKMLRLRLNYKKNEIPEILQEKNQNGQDIEAPNEDEEKLKQLANDPILQLNEMSYCFKCNAIKLPRAHHCRQCGRCVLRMDHHCPWIGNCVGKLNHKHFLLSLFYAVVLLFQICIWGTIFYYLNYAGFVEGLSSNAKLLITSTTVSSGVVFIALGILTTFQIFGAVKNISTVEIHLKDILQRNPFDKGASKNLENLFGTDRKEWLFPIDPKFPSDQEHLLLEEF